MRFFAIALLLLSVNNLAFADLSTDCLISGKTSCMLNSDEPGKEFLVGLPNYETCGVRFVSDTYPVQGTWEDFAEGLYVTSGPTWDTAAEESSYFFENLFYTVGPDQWFMTLFTVYTRSGESLADYVHSKLATRYQPSPTVTLQAVPCAFGVVQPAST